MNVTSGDNLKFAFDGKVKLIILKSFSRKKLQYLNVIYMLNFKNFITRGYMHKKEDHNKMAIKQPLAHKEKAKPSHHKKEEHAPMHKKHKEK